METYIVWKTDYDYPEPDSHILGIYADKDVAIKKKNSYNQYLNSNDDDQTDSENEVLTDDRLEFSTVQNQHIAFITRFTVDSGTKKIHFIKMHESRGGGSYSETTYIWFCSTKEEVLGVAENYFDDEHNRDEECGQCENDNCKKRMLEELGKDKCAEIECTDFEPVFIQIWSKKINFELSLSH